MPMADEFECSKEFSIGFVKSAKLPKIILREIIFFCWNGVNNNGASYEASLKNQESIKFIMQFVGPELCSRHPDKQRIA